MLSLKLCDEIAAFQELSKFLQKGKVEISDLPVPENFPEGMFSPAPLLAHLLESCTQGVISSLADSAFSGEPAGNAGSGLLLPGPVETG